ncbi:MAG: heme exporter protein CcmB, partial [Rhizobiales bacterium]|nr:heme exporter protein CcmB [Hyphomicrobiales bacterium]
VVVLSFTIPVLIFAVSTTAAYTVGAGPSLPPFLILVALTLISAVVAAFAGAAGLRAAME